MSTDIRKRRRNKPPAELINHRDLAARLGIDTVTLRAWVARGSWPEPHAVIEQTWFYRVDLVEYWFRTTEWPASAKFKAGVGRGRDPDPR